jgi:hypothetical protein
MTQSRKPTSSQVPTSVTELQELLREWKPPGRIKASCDEMGWRPGSGAGKACSARVEIRLRETTKDSDASVDRSWSLRFRVRVDPGFEPGGLVEQLEAVAEALGLGLPRAAKVAEDIGFEVVSKKKIITTTPRSVPAPWSDHIPLPYDPLAPGTLFRPIPGWPNYDISPHGLVRSYYDLENRTIAKVPQRILKPKWRKASSSWQVCLFDGKFGTDSHRRQDFSLEELIAMTWGGLAKA